MFSSDIIEDIIMISESLQVIPFTNDDYKNGGMILLPETVLKKIYDINGDKPTYLQITCVHKKTDVIIMNYVGISQNTLKSKHNHSDPGCIVLPEWITNEALLDVGDFVFIEDCKMPTITGITVKNIIEYIHEIPNYKLVLKEYFADKQFMCLQKDIPLSLTYNGIEYVFVVSALQDDLGNDIDYGSIYETHFNIEVENYFETTIPSTVPEKKTVTKPEEPIKITTNNNIPNIVNNSTNKTSTNNVPNVNSPNIGSSSPTMEATKPIINTSTPIDIDSLSPKKMSSLGVPISPRNPKFTPRIVYMPEGFIPFSGGGYTLGTK
jgi:hypothetical protein